MLRCSRRTDKFAKIPNNDLRQHKSLMGIIGKLRVYKETKDIERYGEYGLAAVTDSVRQLQNAIAENYTEKQFAELFNKIDNIYASRHEGYKVGLCGYSYNDDAADASQPQLRIEKLRDFRDEELRKLKLAQLQSAPININQGQEALALATNTVVSNLTNACERIDEVPNDKLSDDDKLKLRGLLAELEQAQQKDSNAKGDRLQKVLSFIADKRADAMIAAASYIGAAVQQFV